MNEQTRMEFTTDLDKIILDIDKLDLNTLQSRLETIISKCKYIRYSEIHNELL